MTVRSAPEILSPTGVRTPVVSISIRPLISRRKLKQVYHLTQFIEPLLQEIQKEHQEVQLVDHGAGVDDSSLPIDEVTSFPVNTDVYVAAELHNAPDDTNITFIWYLEAQEVDSVTINNGDVSDAPLWGILPAELVTTPGNYAVEIYIDDREEPDTVTEFVVK